MAPSAVITEAFYRITTIDDATDTGLKTRTKKPFLFVYWQINVTTTLSPRRRDICQNITYKEAKRVKCEELNPLML